eukprot:COSAG02_NODE_9311_length_2259_cov_1.962037_1_plen_247_part_00
MPDDATRWRASARAHNVFSKVVGASRLSSHTRCYRKEVTAGLWRPRPRVMSHQDQPSGDTFEVEAENSSDGARDVSSNPLDAGSSPTRPASPSEGGMARRRRFALQVLTDDPILQKDWLLGGAAAARRFPRSGLFESYSYAHLNESIATTFSLDVRIYVVVYKVDPVTHEHDMMCPHTEKDSHLFMAVPTKGTVTVRADCSEHILASPNPKFRCVRCLCVPASSRGPGTAPQAPRLKNNVPYKQRA